MIMIKLAKRMCALNQLTRTQRVNHVRIRPHIRLTAQPRYSDIGLQSIIGRQWPARIALYRIDLLGPRRLSISRAVSGLDLVMECAVTDGIEDLAGVYG